MKHKGFEILPSYYPGSDFIVTKDDRIIDRKPKISGIQYYEIFDLTDGSRFGTGTSKDDCKDQINQSLAKMGMADNTEKSWEKVDGYYPGFHQDWKNKQDEVIRQIRDEYDQRRLEAKRCKI